MPMSLEKWPVGVVRGPTDRVAPSPHNLANSTYTPSISAPTPHACWKSQMPRMQFVPTLQRPKSALGFSIALRLIGRLRGHVLLSVSQERLPFLGLESHLRDLKGFMGNTDLLAADLRHIQRPQRPCPLASLISQGVAIKGPCLFASTSGVATGWACPPAKSARPHSSPSSRCIC